MFRNCVPLAAIAALGCLSVPVSAERELAIYDDGIPNGYSSRNMDMSADGRYLVISGRDFDRAPSGQSVAVTDRVLATTEYLRSPVDGEVINDDASVNISKNGRYIVLQFKASLFVENGQHYSYVYDRVLDAWTSLTESFDNSPLQDCAPQYSFGAFTPADVSDNGIVVFGSECSNLVPNDNNGELDIFSYDINSGETALISHDGTSAQASLAGMSIAPSISADGRYVVYTTLADPRDTPCASASEHVVLYDRQQETTLALTDCALPQLRRDFHQPVLASDGSTVVFNADGTKLTSYDIPSATFTDTDVDGLTDFLEVDRGTDVSADGRYFIFSSLKSYDVNGILIEPLSPLQREISSMTRLDRLTGKKETISTHYVTGKPLDDSVHNESAISGNGEVIAFGVNATGFYLEHEGASENGVVISRDDGFAHQYRSVHARNSEDGFSAYNGMVLVADNLWVTELEFDGIADQLKFDMGGSWDDGVDFGDNNNDGIAEPNGGNISINDGAGRYRVTFNDQTNYYTITKLSNEVYTDVFVRGTFNTWQAEPMTSRGKNIWEAVVDFTSDNERFKFDIHGDWSENYGDTALDFVGEAGGNDILIASKGKYLVRFYADTKQYSLEPLVFALDASERPEQDIRIFLPDLKTKTLVTTDFLLTENNLWTREADVSEFKWSSDALAEDVIVSQENRTNFNRFNSVGTKLTHAGEFDLTLTVTDLDGRSGSATARITVEEAFAPIANAGPDLTVLVGTNVTFDSSLSSDPDGEIRSIIWDVDGRRALAGRFLFSETGTFEAAVEVRDDDSLGAVDTMTVTVVNSLPGSNVTASCLNANTVFGQDVYVVGSTPELGSWNALNGVLLNTTDGVDWSGNLGLLPAGQNVQWKCVKVFNGNVEWQAGDDNSFSTNIDNMSISGSF